MCSRLGLTLQAEKACNCRGSPAAFIGSNGAGWEGTAILQHGSVVTFGCLQFVFSIVDHVSSITKDSTIEANIKSESISTILKENFNTSILRPANKSATTPSGSQGQGQTLSLLYAAISIYTLIVSMFVTTKLT